MDVTDEVIYIGKLNRACNLILSKCKITTHVNVNVILYNCLYTQTGRTPLLLACKNGLSDVAQLLINKTLNVDVADKVS